MISVNLKHVPISNQRWLKCLIQKVNLNVGTGLSMVYECKQLSFETLKRTNDSFSGLFFWLTLIYLMAIILIAYFSLSFLFDREDVPLIRISLLYGSFMFMITLYFLNSMSQDVTGKGYTH